MNTEYRESTEDTSLSCFFDVSVDADLKTGQLKKLIYENKFVKVSLTVDEDGTRNMEEDTMDKAD